MSSSERGFSSAFGVSPKPQHIVPTGCTFGIRNCQELRVSYATSAIRISCETKRVGCKHHVLGAEEQSISEPLRFATILIDRGGS
jgi:hypothetical protein